MLELGIQKEDHAREAAQGQEVLALAGGTW